MPVNYELVWKHALIVHELHECCEILLLWWVAFDKIENDSLQQTFYAYFTVALNKFKEGHLVLGPEFYNVPFILEYATKQDVILVLWSDIHNKLDLSNFCQKIINFSFTLTDVRIKLRDDLV